MQMEELTKANITLEKELHKLKEERKTQEQLVNYFAEELKQSRDKQKEMIERERQVMGLIQKIMYSNEGTEREREDMKKKLLALRSQQQQQLASTPSPLGEELVSAFVGVKIENGHDHTQLQDAHLGVPRGPLEQPRSPPQPFSDLVVPSSPLWNSWPADFFGNLMDNNDPFMPVPQEVHAVLQPSLPQLVHTILTPSFFSARWMHNR